MIGLSTVSREQRKIENEMKRALLDYFAGLQRRIVAQVKP